MRWGRTALVIVGVLISALAGAAVYAAFEPDPPPAVRPIRLERSPAEGRSDAKAGPKEPKRERGADPAPSSAQAPPAPDSGNDDGTAQPVQPAPAPAGGGSGDDDDGDDDAGDDDDDDGSDDDDSDDADD